MVASTSARHHARHQARRVGAEADAQVELTAGDLTERGRLGRERGHGPAWKRDDRGADAESFGDDLRRCRPPFVARLEDAATGQASRRPQAVVSKTGRFLNQRSLLVD